ncbi:MAG: hypothetical protein N2B05_00995 [Gemmatimonadales bacterium]
MTAPVLGAVPVLNDVDGHLYDAVAAAGGINWADARTAAEGMTSGTCQGYLASITSTEENAFILLNFPMVAPAIGNGYWLGGYQPEGTLQPDAGWLWDSGEAFGFSDWSAGQPDDGGIHGDEDAIHFMSVGGGPFEAGVIGWADLNQTETTLGYVVEFDGVCTDEALLNIMLKLKQGEGARNINLKSQGKIAAAVLSVDGEFDATTIDPTTVTLGDGADLEAHVAGNKHGKLMVSWPDLNEDGLNDALFHFNTQDLVAAGLIAETTELVLHGMTTDGVEFTGTDAVAVK